MIIFKNGKRLLPGHTMESLPFFSKRKEGVFLDNILKCDNIEKHILPLPRKYRGSFLF